MNKGFFDSTNPFINVGLNPDLLSLLHKLLATVRTSSAGYNQVIAGITLQILGTLNAVSMQQEDAHDPTAKLISKAKFMLEESLDKPVDWDAQSLEKHLNKARENLLINITLI